MTNLLLNAAQTNGPQAGGRALFSVRPAAAASPNQAQVAPRFEDAFRGAQVPTLDLVATPDSFAPFARREGESEATFADDALAPDVDDIQSEAQIALLPSIAPLPVAPATAAIVPVALPAVVSESHVKIPATVSEATAPVLGATVAAVVVPMVLKDVSGAERARAQAALPSLAGALPSVATAKDESVAATATSAGPSAARGGNVEAVVASAERSMMLLAAQAHAFTMPTVAAKEQIAAEAINQPNPAARQSLAAALGERLHIQINQRSEHAVIRLDPPSMGSIEIVVRHEAGGVQVQMRASNPEVARQLHGIGDTLRQDLVQRQHGDVSVQVWDGSRDGDGRQRQRAMPWQDDPGHALRETAEEHEPAAFALNASE